MLIIIIMTLCKRGDRDLFGAIMFCMKYVTAANMSTMSVYDVNNIDI